LNNLNIDLHNQKQRKIKVSILYTYWTEKGVNTSPKSIYTLQDIVRIYANHCPVQLLLQDYNWKYSDYFMTDLPQLHEQIQNYRKDYLEHSDIVIIASNGRVTDVCMDRTADLVRDIRTVVFTRMTKPDVVESVGVCRLIAEKYNMLFSEVDISDHRSLHLLLTNSIQHFIRLDQTDVTTENTTANTYNELIFDVQRLIDTDYNVSGLISVDTLAQITSLIIEKYILLYDFVLNHCNKYLLNVEVLVNTIEDKMLPYFTSLLSQLLDDLTDYSKTENQSLYYQQFAKLFDKCFIYNKKDKIIDILQNFFGQRIERWTELCGTLLKIVVTRIQFLASLQGFSKHPDYYIETTDSIPNVNLVLLSDEKVMPKLNIHCRGSKTESALDTMILPLVSDRLKRVKGKYFVTPMIGTATIFSNVSGKEYTVPIAAAALMLNMDDTDQWYSYDKLLHSVCGVQTYSNPKDASLIFQLLRVTNLFKFRIGNDKIEDCPHNFRSLEFTIPKHY
jgi:hypothetical protein